MYSMCYNRLAQGARGAVKTSRAQDRPGGERSSRVTGFISYEMFIFKNIHTYGIYGRYIYICVCVDYTWLIHEENALENWHSLNFMAKKKKQTEKKRKRIAPECFVYALYMMYMCVLFLLLFHAVSSGVVFSLETRDPKSIKIRWTRNNQETTCDWVLCIFVFVWLLPRQGAN
jgi:hypothetical protein